MDGPGELGVRVPDGEAEEVEAFVEGRVGWLRWSGGVVPGEKRWGQGMKRRREEELGRGCS